MNTKPPSAYQQARAEKQKTAAVEGAKAMAEREQQNVAVRKNMERLRAMRLAKEAEEAASAPTAAPKAKKASSRTSKSAKSAGKDEKAPELSAWLAQQRAAGQRS